ncbi:hypothetical protein LZ575_12660 [Antarcticibacterium sp. 1MA-6-2]|uniref:hypothetical protein n=1 Tax=Antarcticibacterium sp. 1MA-6-2 TaxID=2908210 RepID=UPI001F3F6F4F|nr:hypothetical protein [Antarcticibacterium sp. 1MA-6-2]UJH89851.1 hypothetical protein LZ575_12660 [Antarcticibacterium sp. 1MA-6-2]
MNNVKVHNKNLFLVYRGEDDLQIKAGLRHIAQWGGTSEEEGKRPQSMKDYLKVVT